MERIAFMDAPTCERLWRDHADRLLLYAASILGDRSAAEDALQNVFARLYAAGGPSEMESEAAYLFRAVRNESLNALRSSHRAERARGRLFERDAQEPRDDADLREGVEAALGGLPDEQREAVVLRIWGGFSMPEAAAVLGISEKTFEHRYYRGLAALEEKLHD